MVDDIIYRGQSPVGNLNNHNSQGEGVVCCLVSEYPNLPCGKGAKRKRTPSSNLRKILRERNIVRSQVGCREGSSFLCYVINVVVDYYDVVGPSWAVVFVSFQ